VFQEQNITDKCQTSRLIQSKYEMRKPAVSGKITGSNFKCYLTLTCIALVHCKRNVVSAIRAFLAPAPYRSLVPWSVHGLLSVVRLPQIIKPAIGRCCSCRLYCWNLIESRISSVSNRLVRPACFCTSIQRLYCSAMLLGQTKCVCNIL
jgi:hypothetical protein